MQTTRSRFHQWTLGRRLGFGFATTVALAMVIGAASYVGLRQVRGGLFSLTSNIMPGLEIANSLGLRSLEYSVLTLKHIISAEPAEYERIDAQCDALVPLLHADLQRYEPLIFSAEDRRVFDPVSPAFEHYRALARQARDLSNQGKKSEAEALINGEAAQAYADFTATIQALLHYNEELSAAEASTLTQIVNRTASLVTVLSIVVIVLGTVAAILIARGVNRAVRTIADSINDSSSQVASASGQVSASSQSLAEGASEQAASLEETSASLEEMSSMAKRNLENAEQAKELAGQTRNSADAGAEQMSGMRAAMDEIKESSDEIGKIVKTIDEIAFQTNILALNAAVEAARAGEFGSGFAVVAEEVRALAQRSAQSARETAGKIEIAIQKSNHGVAISANVAAALAEIVEKARRVDSFVGEIAQASREQNEGIRQVNTAVSQMDKVTQSNASSAEETAAAAEELSSQSQSLRETVEALLRLVDGSKAATAATSAGAGDEHAARQVPRVAERRNSVVVATLPVKPAGRPYQDADAKDAEKALTFFK